MSEACGVVQSQASEGLSLNAACVIYRITHVESGRVYVGQTVKKAMYRKKEHWNAALRTDVQTYRNNRMYITNALRKHGVDAFRFEVIERCSSRAELDEREAFWIRKLNALSPNGFNLRSGPLGMIGAEIAPEVGQRISKANKGRVKTPEWRAALSKSHTGKKMSATARQNLSNAMRGKTRVYSSDRNAKISATLKGQPCSKERKAAIRTGMTEEGKEQTRRANLGVKRSEETREKLRAAWEIRRVRERIFGR